MRAKGWAISPFAHALVSIIYALGWILLKIADE
jgi:hypothetical protein